MAVGGLVAAMLMMVTVVMMMTVVTGDDLLPKYLASPPCPGPCSCTNTVVNCSGSSLQRFPTIDPYMHTVDLSGNTLSDYPGPDSGDDYNGVVALNLSYNRFRRLPPFDRLGLWSVRSLDLSNNVIVSWRETGGNPLHQAFSLEHLNLSSNLIQSMQLDSLESDTLLELDVSMCEITTLSYKSIVKLTSLKKLSIAHNPITNIPGLISNSLEELDASWCQLKLVSLAGLQKLSRLDVSGNPHLYKLGTVPGTLTRLAAASCSIDYLDTSGYPRLVSLDLRDNRIQSLLSMAFANNSRLTDLNLSGNAIEYLDPEEFKMADSLLRLDLSSNKLKGYDPYSFRGLTDLRTLNLSRNSLTRLEDLDCPKLTELDASHCDIAAISPTLLGRLPSLRYLNLSRNSIEALPPGLVSGSLAFFDLGFNRISDFRPSGRFNSLKILVLSGNRLTEPLSRQTTRDLQHTRILLDNNPWRCDCSSPEFVAFHDYLVRRPPLQRLECRSPENSTGLTWAEACFKRADTYTGGQGRDRAWIPLVISLTAIIFLVCLLAGVKRMLDSGRAEVARTEVDDDSSVSIGEQRSSSSVNVIQRLNELPSYEEALLLPRLNQRGSQPQVPPYSPPTPPPRRPPPRHITSSLVNLTTHLPQTTKLSASI